MSRKYIIETKNSEKVELTSRQLYELLIEKGLNTDKKFDDLLEELIKELSQTGTLNRMSFLQICEISATLGYYYKLFLDKNNVTIIEGKSDNA